MTAKWKRWTDAQVLEMRRLYEQEGQTPQKIQAAFGISAAYLHKILAYEVRGRLVPDTEEKRGCRKCGHFYDADLGRYGCPNCAH